MLCNVNNTLSPPSVVSLMVLFAARSCLEAEAGRGGFFAQSAFPSTPAASTLTSPSAAGGERCVGGGGGDWGTAGGGESAFFAEWANPFTFFPPTELPFFPPPPAAAADASPFILEVGLKTIQLFQIAPLIYAHDTDMLRKIEQISCISGLNSL